MSLALPANLPEDVRALFGPSDNVHSTSGHWRMTPLLHVVKKKRKDMEATVAAVESLLRAGANVHAKDKDGNTALHFVCSNAEGRYSFEPEDSPLGKVLLAAGADFEAVNHIEATPFDYLVAYRILGFLKHHAAPQEEEEHNILAIDRNTVVDAKSGDTLLHVALFSEDSKFIDVEVVKLLIAGGADIHAANKDGVRPVDIVDKMLRLDVPAEARRRTSVLERIQTVIGEVVPVMIAHGADLDASEIGAKVLHKIMQEFKYDWLEDIGIFEVHIDPLMELIDIDWNYANDDDGYTALHVLLLCRRWGNFHSWPDEDVDTMTFLATTIRGVHSRSQRTLDLNAKTKEGVTLLDCAAKLGSLILIRELCDLGADIGLTTDSDGWTPLHFACRGNDDDTERQLDVVRTLIDCGVNVDAVTHGSGKTALHLACRDAVPQVIDVMVEATNDILAKDLSGMTALHYALDRDEFSLENYVRPFFFPSSQDGVGRQLKGASLIVAGGKTKQTPLHMAAERGYRTIVEWILDLDGVDENVIDAVEFEGRTALQLAARKGHTECVFFLVRRTPVSSFCGKRRRPSDY